MFYGIFSTIAFIVILPFWLVFGIFKPKLLNGFKEKCGFFSTPVLKKSKTIAFYGVSVGEVIAMENLIKKTRENSPEINIIIMTGTKTGQEIAKKKLGKTATFITYFPFDFPFCIKNMLSKIQPNAVFVAETELWPNFAHIMSKKQIPLYIINARISDRTFNSYKKLQFVFEPILKNYTNIYPQSKQDCEKLVSLGANPETTEIMGNLKFDIKKPNISELNFEKNPEHLIILAGSTHTGEDEIVLGAFEKLKKEIPNLKLMIAPRHPERNENVFKMMQDFGTSSKRSQNANFNDNDLILLDTMGELGKFYSICDVAFIGGSFTKTGGHNPLEATIFNKPVISGPSIHNFKDIYAILTRTDCAKITKNKIEFKNQLKKLLTDKDFYQKASNDCEKVFEQNKGALEFVLKVLQKLV